MRLDFGLQIQQQQRLVMTAELRQAIAILQLPVTEMADAIETELLENPCLEAELREEPDEPEFDAQKLLEYLGDSEGSRGSAAMPESEDDPGFEPFVALMPTLQEHLITQLLLAGLSDSERRIGEFLINSLDDNGYLTLTTSDAAEKLGVPIGLVDRVLQVVQSFDPSGVGARSLRECLLLQWATVDGGNPLVPVLIEKYLDELADGRITKIAEACRVTPQQVQEAIDALRTLDPKPGRQFGRANDTRYIVPDVVVERVERNYVVLVNEAPVPRLQVSTHYRRMLSGAVEPEARKFIEQKIHSALWLIKAVEQRRLTLQRVTEAIVRFQRGFFEHGARYLRPLTLRDVADEVSVHESTVSRTISGKYVQTPRGTFELKFFFSSGVESAGGVGVAAGSVKRMIADLIEREESTEPLSDQALAGLLNQQGVHISRRTVAKYREEIGIPSTTKRKRYK